MSWSSLSAGMVALLLWSVPAVSQRMICPRTLNGHILLDVALFDGPIGGLGEMLPVDGAWNLGNKSRSPEGFQISCRYQGIKDALAVRLPDELRSCQYVAPEGEGGIANVGCE